MEMQKKRMKLRDRWKAKTPKFWKKIQRIALITGAISGAILTAPISLPGLLITSAGYIAVASSTIAGMSQLTKEDQEEN